MNLISHIENFILKGIRNFDCGNLNRIGKSISLKFFIKRYIKENPDCTPVIIVDNFVTGDAKYREIENLIITTPAIFPYKSRGLKNCVVFADEVYFAEELAMDSRVKFICGTYSSNFTYDEIKFVKEGGIDKYNKIMKLLEKNASAKKIREVINSE